MKKLTFGQAFKLLEKEGVSFDKHYGYLEVLDSTTIIYHEDYVEMVESEIWNILYNCEKEQVDLIIQWIDYGNVFDSLCENRNIYNLEDNYEEEDLLYVGAF